MLLAACGGSSDNALDSSAGNTEDTAGETTTSTLATTTTTRPTTTTARPTTTSPESGTAAIVCDAFGDFVDENPEARVIEAMAVAGALRDGLVDKGWDPSSVGERVSRECDNGYDNVALMAYGGWGPRADAVSFTLDRGSCSSRGDYGGVLSMAGSGGKFTVELSLEYTANNVVEHQGSEYVDVEAGGSGVAFEFYMPQLPSGGTCEVELVSVRPT